MCGGATFRRELESRPARGGWIEIALAGIEPSIEQSRPARGGWIEITLTSPRISLGWSRPARGGWIEMAAAKRGHAQCAVPPRKGRVD